MKKGENKALMFHIVIRSNFSFYLCPMSIYRGSKPNKALYLTAVALALFIIIYCLIPERYPRLPDAALTRLLDDSLEKKILQKIDSASTYDYYVIARHSNPYLHSLWTKSFRI